MVKIEAKYSKTARGQIAVDLTVKEAGDFPNRDIFNSGARAGDWSSNHFFQKNSDCVYLLVYDSPDKAQDEVRNIIEVIHTKLNEWREMRVPETETFIF